MIHQFNEIEINIQNHNFDKAKEMIDSLCPMTKAQKRQSAHLQSRYYLYQNDFQKSREILTNLLNDYQSHIGPLCDLITLDYMQERKLEFKKRLHLLEREIDLCRLKLTNENLSKTLICLAKFLEVDGRNKKAQNIYKEVLELLPSGHPSNLNALAQLIRLQARWNIKQNLTSYYERLFFQTEKDNTLNQNIEVQHALYAAELKLFGLEIAKKRKEKIFKNLDPYDQNLFLIEELEYSYFSGLIPKNIKKQFNQNELSQSEKSLLELSDKVIPDFQGLKETSWSSDVLRLMAITIKITQSHDLQKLYFFLTDNFSNDDKKLWHKLIETSKKSKSSLIYNKEKFELKFENQSLNIKRKQNARIIFDLFLGNESLSIEEFVKRAYNLSYDENSYHRARMAIKRTNQLITKELALADCFTIDKELIRANIEIK